MQPPEFHLRPAGWRLPRLIVCERKGQWATALRVIGGVTAASILETRSLFDCGQELQAHPRSFVVVELSARNAPAVLDWLAQLEQLDPGARGAVVADRWLRSWEPVVREAGAVWFVTSPRDVGPLARMARRHLDAVPKAPREFVEEVWDWLPWARY